MTRLAYIFAMSIAMAGTLALSPNIRADEGDAPDASEGTPASVESGETHDDKPPKLPPPEGAKRLSPEYDIWIDRERGVVIMDGQVSLRRGPLEMFACTRNSKEHESVVSVNTQAFLAHAALLTLGAEPGHPVKFVPEFVPPAGTEIEITVEWLDLAGKWQKARAEEWVRDVKTGKEMTHPWVFAGSGFGTDETTGRQRYLAEFGDFICVSNFSTAMLDIPVASTQANEGLLFEAFTKRVPALGTPVRVVLKPKLEKKGEEQGASGEE